jgi:uncharacterized protein (TIGR01777 family)
VNLRMGNVMGAQGGALGMLLPVFKAGLGGVVGDGTQYVPWIDRDDVARAWVHLLHHEEVDGPVNVTSPNPVTNEELTRTLGHVVHRPTFVRVPEAVARWTMRDVATNLLLPSQRVVCPRLEKTAFQFRYATLEACLRHQVDEE